MGGAESGGDGGCSAVRMDLFPVSWVLAWVGEGVVTTTKSGRVCLIWMGESRVKFEKCIQFRVYKIFFVF